MRFSLRALVAVTLPLLPSCGSTVSVPSGDETEVGYDGATSSDSSFSDTNDFDDAAASADDTGAVSTPDSTTTLPTDSATPPIDVGPDPCSATVVGGAVALSDTYSSALGGGGYSYAFDDKAGSSICLSRRALCAKGATGVGSSTTWGAGMGFNLNQPKGPGTTIGTYAASGAGIAYSLSNLPPQGARLIIDNAGVDYCATLTAASGTVPWSAFNSKCWDGSGTKLSGPPTGAKHVQFQITPGTSTSPFDFCVTSLSFASTAPIDAGPPDTGGPIDTGSPIDTGPTAPCTWGGGPSSPNGRLTCYWFGQGTATGGGCSSYKTYCGYCGTETGTSSGGYCPSSIKDSVSNIATPHFVAFPSGTFGSGTYCGMCVDVSWGGKTITATVIDACATCGESKHLDLSLSAAMALGLGVGGATGDATTGVTWKAVSCPTTSNIVAVYNAGYSGQLYFQNGVFPVASARSAGKAATRAYGYWDFGAPMAGKTVTLTDTLGHTITGTIPSSSGGSIGAQFPGVCM